MTEDPCKLIARVTTQARAALQRESRHLTISRELDEIRATSKNPDADIAGYLESRALGDQTFKYAKYKNADSVHITERAVITGIMNDVLARLMPSTGDVVRDATRELSAAFRNRSNPSQRRLLARQTAEANFGGRVDSPEALAYSNTLRQAGEYVVSRYRAAGIDVTYDPERQFIVHHIRDKFQRADVAEWKGMLYRNLDLGRMVNKETGKPFTPEELDPVLDSIFDNIITDGAAALAPGTPTGRALWSRLDETRFFVWKDYKSWAEYNDRFGYGDDILPAIMGWMDKSARNIALLDVYSSSPSTTNEYLKKLARTTIQDKEKAAEVASRLETNYRKLVGDLDRPENVYLSDLGAVVRGSTYTSLLGGASLLQAVIEPVNLRAARIASGLESQLGFTDFTRAAAEIIRRGGEAEAAKTAARLGVSMQLYQAGVHRSITRDGFLPAARYFTGVTSDLTNRMSGGRHLVAAQQAVFGKNFVYDLTDNRMATFAELPDNLKQTMERFGIAPSEWNRFRASSPLLADAGDGLPAFDLVKAATGGGKDGETARRMLSMVNDISRKNAVITPDAYTQLRLTGGTRPGTAAGEIVRASTSLLGYTHTFTTAVLRGRLLDPRYGKAPAGRVANTLYYAGLTFLATWSAFSLREVVNGKDLPDFTPPNVGKVFLMSGAGAMVGDLVARFSQRERLQDVLGPGISAGLGLISAGSDAVSGDFSGAGQELLRSARTLTPVPSTFYTNLAVQRLFWDQVELFIDPKAAQRKLRNDAKRGTTNWWERYETAPDRFPELPELPE